MKSRTFETMIVFTGGALLLILITFLEGCGVDPDDYAPKQADGCPSSGCPETEQEAPEAPAPEPKAEAAEPDPVSCPEGKVCIGMTKEQVLAILPEPSRVTSDDTIGHTGWHYKEQRGKSYVCYEKFTFASNDCSLHFYDGVLGEQIRVKPKWLEL